MTTPRTYGVLGAKPGVQFTTIAPGGFRLLAAIENAARTLAIDLTITSACDGVHSGPDDPHHRGAAYDVRTKGLTEWKKDRLLEVILTECKLPDEPPPMPVADFPRSQATARFFGFIEAAGSDNEHIHVQVRRGYAYP